MSRVGLDACEASDRCISRTWYTACTCIVIDAPSIHGGEIYQATGTAVDDVNAVCMSLVPPTHRYITHSIIICLPSSLTTPVPPSGTPTPRLGVSGGLRPPPGRAWGPQILIPGRYALPTCRLCMKSTDKEQSRGVHRVAIRSVLKVRYGVGLERLQGGARVRVP